MRRPRAGETGLTLVEMLVVLAIIGVMAGLTALGMGAARGPNAEAEARRLAQRIQLAADDVMVTDGSVAFLWNERGYGFLTREGGEWRQEQGNALAWHRLSGGLRLDLGRKPGPLPLGIEGMAIPFQAVIGGDGARRWAIRFDGVTARIQPLPGTPA